MKPIAKTPATFIRTIIAAYERQGLDPNEALAASQIAPLVLADPDGRVTARQLEAFTDIAMRDLQDEGLGWFSRPLPWGTYGMLCRATLPSPDLRVALARWCRHYGLVVNDIRLTLTATDQRATLTIEEATDLGEYREFCLVTTFRNIHGFACWLVDSNIALTEVQFPYPQPAHADVYDLMFRAPVRFGRAQASLSFDAAYLKLAVRRHDEDLRKMLLRPLPLIVLQYRRDRLLSQRIRHLLRTQRMRLSNVGSLASELNVSARSLHRHLAEEGTTLQKIKDEVRLELAIHELRHTDRLLKQIASNVGFSNEASFIRAFKQWTGLSPGEFRRTSSDRHKA